MRRRNSWQRSAAGFLALIACVVSPEDLAGEEEAGADGPEVEPGFVLLFNGRDFEGWTGDFDGKRAVDGVLEWTGGGHLWTEAEYGDFILRLEFTLSPGANNGLAIRWTGEGDPAYTGMCELQILDNNAAIYADLDPRQYHGSAYGMAAAKRGFLRPTGEWNAQEVRVEGSRIRVRLNGTEILDADLENVSETMGGKEHPGRSRDRGHLGFAGHGEQHQLLFRNIRLRTLDEN